MGENNQKKKNRFTLSFVSLLTAGLRVERLHHFMQHLHAALHVTDCFDTLQYSPEFWAVVAGKIIQLKEKRPTVIVSSSLLRVSNRET